MSNRSLKHILIRASAGSGKTHQLTNRYIGLLAAGVEPRTILATTFTRKAAAEIHDRVLVRLARAADCPREAEELARQLHVESKGKPDFKLLLRRTLRSLHQTRISTLDSFTVSLARNFGLELGLPPDWKICEETDEKELRSRALEHLLEQQPDDIGRLLPLLSKGETKRSVHDDLHEVISSHYAVYRGSDRAAWECFTLPAPVSEEERTRALEQLWVFDLAACGCPGLAKTRARDIERFKSGDWYEFVTRGIAGTICSGAARFGKKKIPEEVRSLYQPLLQHAKRELLTRLAEQTRATWDFLDRFHQYLWSLKLKTGWFRFDDVTHAVANAQRNAASPQLLQGDFLAFRLDGPVHHLLLDEFQDTSLVQWHVLKPLAQRITQGQPNSGGYFFCVGDVKQAIYGWRGGMADIFDTLQDFLGNLQEIPLVESRRSTQPIIDVVNKVFGDLRQCSDKTCAADLKAWLKRFQKHKTIRKETPGYVCLWTGPGQKKDEDIQAVRGRHYRFVAEKIQELVQQIPSYSVGVLCRTNDAAARVIYELRKLQVPASEEGGNPLTDSPAVELILSLFAVADHPGHSAAWFHLENSPLKKDICSRGPEVFSAQLRQELLVQGYGKFTNSWAERLAPACDERDLRRLQQLVEVAYNYQPRATLRPAEFVAEVREQRVLDPSNSRVRVMTIHAAKGLQFDSVVLPQLDVMLTGRAPNCVVGRDPKTLDVTFVSRYVSKEIQQFLKAHQKRAFEEEQQHRVEEALSLLYVAMTRAIHALYMYVPGPRSRRTPLSWHDLLIDTLAPLSANSRKDETRGKKRQSKKQKDKEENQKQKVQECGLVYEHGDANWHEIRAGAPATAATGEQHRPATTLPRIEFRPSDAVRRRGLEHVVPSQHGGKARVRLESLFAPHEGTGPEAGTLYHAWFALVQWLEDGIPTDDALRREANKLRCELSETTWSQLDRLLANFRAWLDNPGIGSVLRRSAYDNPRQKGFPAALGPVWNQRIKPLLVECERKFLVRDGAALLKGSLDRVVWLGEGDNVVAADIIDFKTDAISPGDAAALTARTEHYRPQMADYQRAAAKLAGLAQERVSIRLVFTSVGQVVALQSMCHRS